MSTAPTLRVLGISGSLRKGSSNSALLRAAVELAPPGVQIETCEIRDIPAFDEDLRAQGNPPAVEQFRARIAAADAVLIATPEYNYSIPGVLKNAIDWASRPPSQPFEGKPVAIMGASGGMLGTARAQYHLRQVFVFMNAHVVNKPEVFVGRVQEKIDAEGRLTDEPTLKQIAALVESLAAWTRRLAQ